MDKVYEQLHDVKAQLRRLILLYNQLKDDKQRLIDDNLRLRTQLEQEQKKVAELENKNVNLQLTRKFTPGGKENAELKQKLDYFIREIDACIAHLKS